MNFSLKSGKSIHSTSANDNLHLASAATSVQQPYCNIELRENVPDCVLRQVHDGFA